MLPIFRFRYASHGRTCPRLCPLCQESCRPDRAGKRPDLPNLDASNRCRTSRPLTHLRRAQHPGADHSVHRVRNPIQDGNSPPCRGSGGFFASSREIASATDRPVAWHSPMRLGISGKPSHKGLGSEVLAISQLYHGLIQLMCRRRRLVELADVGQYRMRHKPVKRRGAPNHLNHPNHHFSKPSKKGHYMNVLF
jgi:hypothetical protein